MSRRPWYCRPPFSDFATTAIPIAIGVAWGVVFSGFAFAVEFLLGAFVNCVERLLP